MIYRKVSAYWSFKENRITRQRDPAIRWADLIKTIEALLFINPKLLRRYVFTHFP